MVEAYQFTSAVSKLKLKRLQLMEKSGRKMLTRLRNRAVIFA
jgi:hypothetical protein